MGKNWQYIEFQSTTWNFELKCETELFENFKLIMLNLHNFLDAYT